MTATKETMDAIHQALGEQLLKAIREGETVLNKEGEAIQVGAKAATLNVARQFLKDNGIDAVATRGSPLKALEESFAELDEDDPDNVVQFGLR